MSSRPEANREIVRFLQGVPLFSCLSGDAAGVLVSAGMLRRLEKGEVLFLQSDPSDSVYVVRSGRVAIVLASSDGREMVINEMRAGDILGELGVLTRRSRSATAIAQAGSELFEIPRRPFLSVVESEPRLARHLLEITAHRLQMSGQREGALAFLDAQARLARLLLELEEQARDKGYITISQEELAGRTGLIRQTVAKALGKWRRAGWLITGRGRIMILNRKALEGLERNLRV